MVNLNASHPIFVFLTRPYLSIYMSNNHIHSRATTTSDVGQQLDRKITEYKQLKTTIYYKPKHIHRDVIF